MWFDIVPQLRCGGRGAARFAAASLLAAACFVARAFDDVDARFFLDAAMQTSSGSTGRSAKWGLGAHVGGTLSTGPRHRARLRPAEDSVHEPRWRSLAGA